MLKFYMIVDHNGYVSGIFSNKDDAESHKERAEIVMECNGQLTKQDLIESAKFSVNSWDLKINRFTHKLAANKTTTWMNRDRLTKYIDRFRRYKSEDLELIEKVSQVDTDVNTLVTFHQNLRYSE